MGGPQWTLHFRMFRNKPVLTPCWNCFFDLLSVNFVTVITHNGLPQRILPLCLTVKIKCPYSEEINTSHAWGFLLFYKIWLMAILVCLLTSSIFNSGKNLASRPWQNGYLETLIGYLLCQPALRMQSLPPHLVSCREQSKLGLLRVHTGRTPDLALALCPQLILICILSSSMPKCKK